jgi:predicted Rossmann-fold nucleotide-binding protein
MDELFESMTLIQTGKMAGFPIIVMGTDFYKDTIAMIEHMKKEGTISPKDMDLLLFTDDIEEAVRTSEKICYRKIQA